MRAFSGSLPSSYKCSDSADCCVRFVCIELVSFQKLQSTELDRCESSQATEQRDLKSRNIEWALQVMNRNRGKRTNVSFSRKSPDSLGDQQWERRPGQEDLHRGGIRCGREVLFHQGQLNNLYGWDQGRQDYSQWCPTADASSLMVWRHSPWHLKPLNSGISCLSLCLFGIRGLVDADMWIWDSLKFWTQICNLLFRFWLELPSQYQRPPWTRMGSSPTTPLIWDLFLLVGLTKHFTFTDILILMTPALLCHTDKAEGA